MNSHRLLKWLFAAGLLACAPAWASSAEPAKSASGTDAANKAAGTASLNPAAAFQSSNYKLRPTDLITVTVVEDPHATGDFKVDVDGTVSLTYLPDHPIKLVGLSTSDAARAIIKAYVEQGIFVKPSITVAVKTPAPRYVKFIGQVMKQGPIEIPPSKEMTLATALAEAGGPTSVAGRYVTITRIMDDGTTKTIPDVDLLAAVKQGKDVPLQEGDIITLGQSVLGDVWH